MQFSLDTLVPTWGNGAPTLIFSFGVTGVQGEGGGVKSTTHRTPPPGDLGRGGQQSGAPQLDEEPAPDAPLGGRYFFSCTSHFTLKLKNYVHAHIFTMVFWL